MQSFTRLAVVILVSGLLIMLLVPFADCVIVGTAWALDDPKGRLVWVVFTLFSVAPFAAIFLIFKDTVPGLFRRV